MELQGRLTEPMVLREDSAHYEPISWDEAFELVASELKSLSSPIRRCSTHLVGQVMRQLFFINSLHANTAQTIYPIAQICVMNLVDSLREMIGVGRAQSP